MLAGGLDVPDSVQGKSFAEYITTGGSAIDPSGGAALLQCAHPFGEWTRTPGASPDDLSSGREYRGLRTLTHKYVRTLSGPWLLFDLEADPYEMTNIVSDPSQQSLVQELDGVLSAKLAECGDPFASGDDMITKWGYVTAPNGTVPYTN